VELLMNPFEQAWSVLKMPQEARRFAEQQHEGQMYGEEPYMTHVDEVASQFDDPHMQRIAYLHDTVEDGKIGIDDIHEHFGEDVGHAVDAMTRRQDESYFDYIARVGEHPKARQVKMADLTHNLSGDPPGSLRQRYEKALEILNRA
jgi:guanosine-3',5'-bis(diphosphate) 3'-pyrophosphohydrolase